MQNSAVIIKIEYKFSKSENWTEIKFTLGSAKFEQSSKLEPGGLIYSVKVPFEISTLHTTSPEKINLLIQRKAIYRITDGNNITYTIGNNQIKARLAYNLVIGGNPGNFKGRQVEITWQNTTGVIIA